MSKGLLWHLGNCRPECSTAAAVAAVGTCRQYTAIRIALSEHVRCGLEDAPRTVAYWQLLFEGAVESLHPGSLRIWRVFRESFESSPSVAFVVFLAPLSCSPRRPPTPSAPRSHSPPESSSRQKNHRPIYRLRLRPALPDLNLRRLPTPACVLRWVLHWGQDQCFQNL